MGEWKHISIILDLDTGRSGQLHDKTTLTPRKSLRYELDGGLGALQTRAGSCKEEILPLPGIETGPSSQLLLAKPTKLS
jgi:hypothetical protein